MNKMVRNQQGFSLIEILVGISLMGMLALGMAEMFTQQARQQAQAQRKADALQVRTAVQSAASDPASIYQSAIQ